VIQAVCVSCAVWSETSTAIIEKSAFSVRDFRLRLRCDICTVLGVLRRTEPQIFTDVSGQLMSSIFKGHAG
jgi:hypothetical protein